jgi:transcriptional regulator with XRE-family HTH domain
VTNHVDQRRKAQGERITDLRRRAHLSQQDVAAKVGVSVRAYADWEKGRSDPKAGNLVRLAQVLKTNPDFIQWGVARQPSPSEMSAWAIEKRLLLIEERLASLDTLASVQTAMAEKLDELIRLLAQHDALALFTELLAAQATVKPGVGDRPGPGARATTGRPRRRAADGS